MATEPTAAPPRGRRRPPQNAPAATSPAEPDATPEARLPAASPAEPGARPAASPAKPGATPEARPALARLPLLAGYGWLATAGILWAASGLAAGPYLYDAALHALFLGFVMSMVFGHAPVILPAVLRVRLPYRPRGDRPLTQVE
ncbi:hypothetical protein [Planobispora takensis]|uniref:hypothetical protein n=1 Tax=Planobispora takensis TaxID=1367882 RepID=UPI001941D4E3|nr:hypothetical protein [Planobispora takensis]